MYTNLYQRVSIESNLSVCRIVGTNYDLSFHMFQIKKRLDQIITSSGWFKIGYVRFHCWDIGGCFWCKE